MMQFEKTEYLGDALILRRKPFEGVAITLDFSSVDETLSNGKKVVKAGTPIDKNGVLANSASVAGILLHDVTEDRPQGTILKKAYINTAVAEKHAGITYDNAVKTALPMVIFE